MCGICLPPDPTLAIVASTSRLRLTHRVNPVGKSRNKNLHFETRIWRNTQPPRQTRLSLLNRLLSRSAGHLQVCAYHTLEETLVQLFGKSPKTMTSHTAISRPGDCCSLLFCLFGGCARSLTFDFWAVDGARRLKVPKQDTDWAWLRLCVRVWCDAMLCCSLSGSMRWRDDGLPFPGRRRVAYQSIRNQMCSGGTHNTENRAICACECERKGIFRCVTLTQIKRSFRRIPCLTGFG